MITNQGKFQTYIELELGKLRKQLTALSLGWFSGNKIETYLSFVSRKGMVDDVHPVVVSVH